MKISKILFLFVLSFLICNSIFPQDKIQGNDTLFLLINKAKKLDKKLFLVFGWEGCGWCRVMAKYHHDPEVNDILSPFFTITEVNAYKTVAGNNLYNTYGEQGTPSWVIFDLNGGVIVNSDNGKGNIGFPTTENDFKHYVYALKKAAPLLSDKECNLLITKLKHYYHQKTKK